METPKVTQRPIGLPEFVHDHNSIPSELWDSMTKTVAYTLDFILDTLDFSPDEASAPQSEDALRAQPTADPLVKDLYAVLVWNDEKHSFDEVIRHITDTCGISLEEAISLTAKVDETGRAIVEMDTYSPALLEVAQGIAKVELGVTVH